MLYLLQVVSDSFCLRSRGAIGVGCRYPGSLLCLLKNYTVLSVLGKGKTDFSKVLLASKATSIEYCVVVGTKFRRVSSLNRVNEVSLSLILRNRVLERPIQAWNKCCANLTRALLTRIYDVLYINFGEV